MRSQAPAPKQRLTQDDGRVGIGQAHSVHDPGVADAYRTGNGMTLGGEATRMPYTGRRVRSWSRRFCRCRDHSVGRGPHPRRTCGYRHLRQRTLTAIWLPRRRSPIFGACPTFRPRRTSRGIEHRPTQISRRPCSGGRRTAWIRSSGGARQPARSCGWSYGPNTKVPPGPSGGAFRAQSDGRGGAIRTLGLLNPIQVRYQAAPRPDRLGV